MAQTPAQDTALSPPANPAEPTPQQRRAMHTIIATQCFGQPAELTLTNGIILLYLTALGVSSERTVLYLSLPMLVESLVRIPGAYAADRVGLKRVAFPGHVLSAIAFTTMIVAGAFYGMPAEALVVLGIVGYGAGHGVSQTSWFALLHPIIPDHLRGRFFGRLRMSWQMVSIVFVGGCALLLPKEAPVSAYQWVIGLTTLGLAARCYLYMQIPELDRRVVVGQSIIGVMKSTLRVSGYMPFCSYVFLLSLCTAAIPIMFGLVEKKVLGFGDDQVVWLGGATMIGAAIGFWIGGKAVDRFGTKPIFMVAHFGFGAVMLLFLARASLGLPVFAVLVGSHLLLGIVSSASSIAVTTELLALVPPQNKSMTTTVCQVLLRGGGALSGILAAWVLETGLLADSWTLWGDTLSRYDSILLCWAILILLLVVTLGLVPSVISKSQWLPRA